jgi:molybdopterin molybdotransferase
MAVLSLSEAREALRAAAVPVSETETVPLEDAFGRVMAETLASPIALPPFSSSAMDGYAVRAREARTEGIRLPVAGRYAAGDAPGVLAKGTAARIFTGAPVPRGADAVVIQEVCQPHEGAVTIGRPAVVGQNVRAVGSSLRAGETLVSTGDRLTAAALGLVASVGIARMSVFRRVRVAVLSTGNELTLPGLPLSKGRIYNSNRYVMRGFLDELDAEIIDWGIVPDDLEATRTTLRLAAASADVIVTSGGMSQGEEDHVTRAVRAEGRVDHWRIAIKPGKPLAFGSVANAAFFGLPGNPVAVWLGMFLLVSPFVRRCQRLERFELNRQRQRADFSWIVRGDRLELLRVRRNSEGGLSLFEDPGSAASESAVWCDGIAAIPAWTTVSPGDVVDFWPGPGR